MDDEASNVYLFASIEIIILYIKFAAIILFESIILSESS